MTQPWIICPECRCKPGDNHAATCSRGKRRFVAAAEPQQRSGGMAPPVVGIAECKPLESECPACTIPITSSEQVHIGIAMRDPNANCPRCGTAFAQVIRDRDREEKRR